MDGVAQLGAAGSPRASRWVPSTPCGGGQNRFGIPFWLVGEFTTHFSLFLLGLGCSRGVTGILTRGHFRTPLDDLVPFAEAF